MLKIFFNKIIIFFFCGICKSKNVLDIFNTDYENQSYQ